MPLRVIAIGKKHESWVVDGIERYQKRLRKPFTLEWVFLPHSSREGLSARQEESERLLSRLKDDDFVILLDERGKIIDSPALASLLEVPLRGSRTAVLIIGGAYGVDETIHRRADFVWSLSLLVFPHQLVRLLLSEQLYRAQEIAAGNPYHHE
ncbi:Ribosomal RNA large subunit methyltransferase H [compost metagenome]|jgi:23S rRNA (pseudouridine1915-N3)-methyltransferase